MSQEQGSAPQIKQTASLGELIGGAPPAAAPAHHGHHGFNKDLESFDFHGDSLPRKHRDTQAVGPKTCCPPIFFMDEVARSSLFKWFVTFWCAVVIALSAAALLMPSHDIVHAKVVALDGFFQSKNHGAAYGLWVGYGTAGSTLAAMMCVYLEPTAAGSGIPDVKSYGNGVILAGVLRFRTYVIRIVGLILVTSSGLFAGTEGPMAHVGAICASGIAMSRCTACRKRLALTDNWNNHKVKLEFMGMGAAMGVAAAFGAPIGGLLFSLEEASTHWNVQMTWRTFFGCCVSTTVAKAAKKSFRWIDTRGFIDFPAHNWRGYNIMRDISGQNFQDEIIGDPVQWYVWELIPFAFIAICMGLVGANFCWFVKKIQILRMKVFLIGTSKIRKSGRVLEVFVVCIISLTVTFFLSTQLQCVKNPFPPMSSGSSSPSGSGSAGSVTTTTAAVPAPVSCGIGSDNCADNHNAYLSFYMHMYDKSCEAGFSSPVATYFFESREFAIKALFSDQMQNGIFPNEVLIMLFIVTYFLTLMTYGSAIPAGLFIPNIMVGACFGRLIGQVVQQVAEGDCANFRFNSSDPTAFAGWFDKANGISCEARWGQVGGHVNPGVYALMGSAGMLAGFTRMTMSLGVIVLEITTNLYMTLPVMITIVLAKTTGDLFTASAYDIVIALKNVPLLEAEIETKGWETLKTLEIAGIGCPPDQLDLIEIRKPFTVADAVAKLLTTKHHAWPVVEDRATMRLLGIMTRPKLLDALEGGNNLPQAADGHVELKSIAEKQSNLDIWKFVSQDPFILSNRTSIYDAHRTFRMLGLRHLCIVNEKHAIVSLVTRKDLCEVVEEFVSDYKQALKDFAESQEQKEGQSDSASPIRKEVSNFSLESGGLPVGAVNYDTRKELRERRRQRAHSNSEDMPELSPAKHNDALGQL